MSVEKLLTKLDGVKKTGKNRWMARCPSHKDRTQSLSVQEEDNGYILCHCHAGCDINQVMSAAGLDLSDLFPERLEDRSGKLPYLLLSEALVVIKREVMIVAMCGSRLMQDQLTDKDRDRLFIAVSRINGALEKVGVRRV